MGTEGSNQIQNFISVITNHLSTAKEAVVAWAKRYWDRLLADDFDNGMVDDETDEETDDDLI